MGIVLIVGLFTSSCASILGGYEEVVTVNSLTPGTKIYIDGYFKGIDSAKVKLKTREDYNVTFKKQGYKNQYFVLDSEFRFRRLFLNMICGPLFPLGALIDALAGSCYTFDTNKISADLEKNKINADEKPSSEKTFGIRGGISTSIASSARYNTVGSETRWVSVDTRGQDLMPVFSYHIGLFKEYKLIMPQSPKGIGLQFGLSIARRNIRMNVRDRIGQYTTEFKRNYLEPFTIFKYYLNENATLGMGYQMGFLLSSVVESSEESDESDESDDIPFFPLHDIFPLDPGVIFEVGYKLKNGPNLSAGCFYGLPHTLESDRKRKVSGEKVSGASINTFLLYLSISYYIF